VERLLLLWDELDEFVGYGWHLATGMAHSVTHRLRRPRLRVAARTITET
jgi:hypothetical protein